jgi:RNA recognition motif-containing protein
VPDEYLPPNKILFLRDLPEDYSKDALAAVFKRFPGFKDLRLVPGRAGIAFAEYEDENGAITAKESMAGVTLGDKTIRVTFQRK